MLLSLLVTVFVVPMAFHPQVAMPLTLILSSSIISATTELALFFLFVKTKVSSSNKSSPAFPPNIISSFSPDKAVVLNPSVIPSTISSPSKATPPLAIIKVGLVKVSLPVIPIFFASSKAVSLLVSINTNLK